MNLCCDTVIDFYSSISVTQASDTAKASLVFTGYCIHLGLSTMKIMAEAFFKTLHLMKRKAAVQALDHLAPL